MLDERDYPHLRIPENLSNYCMSTLPFARSRLGHHRCGAAASSPTKQLDRAVQLRPRDQAQCAQTVIYNSIAPSVSRRAALMAPGLLAAAAHSLLQPSKAAAAAATRQTGSNCLQPGALAPIRPPPMKPLRPPWGPVPDPPGFTPLRQYWQQLVELLQQQLSSDFSPQLVVYQPNNSLPSGSPGDPSRDYDRKRACGTFLEGSDTPYAMCPAPGGDPADLRARDCCRHVAYCVPRSRFALSVLDRQESVVIAPRAAALPPSTWQAILVHEMGHCIDFWTFGGRYLLSNHTPCSAEAARLLTSIDRSTLDLEERADLMGPALLAPLMGGRQLCYSPSTTLQRLVPTEVECTGTAEAGDPRFMLHYLHPPIGA